MKRFGLVVASQQIFHFFVVSGREAICGKEAEFGKLELGDGHKLRGIFVPFL